jgi:dienelactone hydrolase
MTIGPIARTCAGLARTAALAALLAMPMAGAGAADTGDDPAELRRTWDAAWVFMPDDDVKGYQRLLGAQLAAALAARQAPLPVVVYAHGCTGLDETAAETGRFLARAGYLVVAPDGFARIDKPVSCRPVGHRGGLHRAVLGWRQAEVRSAIGRVRALPGVDAGRVYLMGFSEGGITAATMTGAPVRARVVEGWTCHAGWPEYRGLKAPPGEPVLALVAEKDPWFQIPELRGDCGRFMKDRPHSRSVVYGPPGFLHTRHWLSFDAAVQDVILGFLVGA